MMRDKITTEYKKPLLADSGQSDADYKINISNLKQKYRFIHPHRTQLFTELRAQKQDILNAIAIVQPVVFNRRIAKTIIRALLAFTALGSGIYGLYHSLEYQRLLHDTDVAMEPLRFNLTRAMDILNKTEAIKDYVYGRYNWFLHSENALQCYYELKDDPLCTTIQPLCNTSVSSIWDLQSDRFCERDVKAIVSESCSWGIKYFCRTKNLIEESLSHISSTQTEINQLQDTIQTAYDHCDQWFADPFSSATVYYLVLLGLGEITPIGFLLLTLWTKMLTECFSVIGTPFAFSKNEYNALIDINERNEFDDIKHDDSLPFYKSLLPPVDEKLKPFDSRLSFFMAKKEKPESKCGASLLFNSALQEPQLANRIFDMAGISESALLREESTALRHTFELGGHPKNSQGHSLLFSFFQRLQTPKQGAHSAKEVVEKIYEFAEFISVKKKTI